MADTSVLHPLSSEHARRINGSIAAQPLEIGTPCTYA